MQKKDFFKIIISIVIFVILQTYFQNTVSLQNVVSKWSGYFIPITWAIFLAILLEPVVKYFENKFKINKYLSIFVTIIILLLIIFILIIMVIPEIINSLKELNDIFPAIAAKIEKSTEKLINYLAEKNILNYSLEDIEKNISNLIKNNYVNIRNFVFSAFINFISWTVGLTNFLLGLFLAILIIIDKKIHLNTLKNLVTIIFGLRKTNYMMDKLNASRLIFLNYIAGKLLVSFVVGISVLIILLITKTPYATLSAILLGIGNMIPYIGSIIGGIIAFFLILMVSPFKVVFLILAIIISQLIDGFVIGPKIIGDKVGLSTFWVMISMVVFGGLFGIMGMFLGIPIMCIIKLFYNDLLNLRKKEEKE